MPLLVFLLLTAITAQGQVSVTTYRNDLARSGVNPEESILTPANVNPAGFGKLFSLPVDGQVYAQPLYASLVNIPGKGIHNVVFVATEHDSVYAFDADSDAGSNAAPLWHVNFTDPSTGERTLSVADVLGCPSISPEIGITGTPVIDPSTGTIYVVASTILSGQFFHRLHALDITTGSRTAGKSGDHRSLCAGHRRQFLTDDCSVPSLPVQEPRRPSPAEWRCLHGLDITLRYWVLSRLADRV